MTISEEQSIDFLAQTLDKDKNKLVKIINATKDSLVSKLQNDKENNETLLTFEDTVTQKRYFIKTKSRSFKANGGKLMNIHSSPDFEKAYSKGWPIFYIRNHLEREALIYKKIDESLKPYLPILYGSAIIRNGSVMILEHININQENINLKSITNFLSILHSKYYLHADKAKEMKINMHTLKDYKNAQPLLCIMQDLIKNEYPIFKNVIEKDLSEFLANFENNYKKAFRDNLTIAHGDFSIKNLSFTDRLYVYDWELSTYNNPEFDLITFFVHYPQPLTKEIITTFISDYHKACNELGVIKKGIDNLTEYLKINLKLFFVIRFSSILLICKSIKMDYLNSMIQNWLFMYDFLFG